MVLKQISLSEWQIQKEILSENIMESQQPYSVPMKAAFIYLKGLVKINKDRVNNIDSAIEIMNEALEIAPNFNLAKISIDALNSQKITEE